MKTYCIISSILFPVALAVIAWLLLYPVDDKIVDIEYSKKIKQTVDDTRIEQAEELNKVAQDFDDKITRQTSSYNRMVGLRSLKRLRDSKRMHADDTLLQKRAKELFDVDIVTLHGSVTLSQDAMIEILDKYREAKDLLDLSSQRCHIDIMKATKKATMRMMSEQNKLELRNRVLEIKNEKLRKQLRGYRLHKKINIWLPIVTAVAGTAAGIGIVYAAKRI